MMVYSKEQMMKYAGEAAAGLRLKERLLMSYRPAICPFHELLEYVNDGERILDIGCGSGLWLHLANKVKKLGSSLGVDIYKEKIDVASEIAKDEEALSFRSVGADESWPTDMEFDVVSMIDVLHHIPAPCQEDFVRQVGNVSPKRVVFKDIDPTAKFKAAMNSLHDMVLSKQKPIYCRRENVAGWLEDMGYKIIENKRADMIWYSHYMVIGELDT